MRISVVYLESLLCRFLSFLPRVVVVVVNYASHLLALEVSADTIELSVYYKSREGYLLETSVSPKELNHLVAGIKSVHVKNHK